MHKNLFRAYIAIIVTLVSLAPLLRQQDTWANSSYHPTNGQFVWYSAPINNSTSELFTSDEDGSNVRAVTSDGMQNGNPQWHPDGSRIIFDRPNPGQPGNSANHSLYIINRDGQNQTLLLDYLSIPSPLCLDGSCQVYDATFNPAGNKIAFHMLRSGYGVKIMVADYNYSTNSISNLSYMGNSGYLSSTNSDREPIWSSDGTKIVVAHAITSDSRTIRVYNVADGSVHYESAAADWQESPQFGPQSGQNLIVATKPATGELFVINADNGSGESTPFYTNLASLSSASPTWSPNGRKIAWGGTQGKINILDYQTKNLTQFSVDTQGDIKEIDWTFSLEDLSTSLPDVYVECTTEVGKPCTVDIPEKCTSQLQTDPARGTSVVQNGQVTYTPTTNSNQEENYVHVREDELGNTAKCFVKIKFTEPDDSTINIIPVNPLSALTTFLPLVPKTGLVSSLLSILVSGLIVAGVLYFDHRQKKLGKKRYSEK